jgi:hypothetical protein
MDKHPTSKICTQCKVMKPLSDFSKRSASKDGHNWSCRQCRSIAQAVHYEKNSDRIKARVKANSIVNADKISVQRKQFRLENLDRLRADQKAFRKRNPGYRSDYYSEWYKQNRDTQLAKMAEYQKAHREQANRRNRKYGKANRPKMNAAWEKRRAALLRATPPWANQDKILEFYVEASRLTAQTGTPHHVDHIVPLQSRFVCGLHCEANLQILPRLDNIKKSNKTWPGMWPQD